MGWLGAAAPLEPEALEGAVTAVAMGRSSRRDEVARLAPARRHGAGEPAATAEQDPARERDERALDEQRRDARRLAPVADVVTGLRQAGGTTQDVPDDHRR